MYLSADVGECGHPFGLLFCRRGICCSKLCVHLKMLAHKPVSPGPGVSNPVHLQEWCNCKLCLGFMTNPKAGLSKDKTV